MKILYIITGLGLGGAEKQLVSLADCFVEAGHDVSIISLNSDIKTKPCSPKIRISQLNLSKNPFSFLRASIHYLKIIRDFNPDILHSHMFHANIFARINKVFHPQRKLVCTAHSSNEGGKLRMLSYRLTDFLSDINTNVSKEAADIFIKKRAVPSSKIIPVPNGIDTKKFNKNEKFNYELRKELNLDNKVIFLTIARLTKAKNIPNLIRAFALLLKSHKECRLIIVGEGEERKNIEKIIIDENISEFVLLLGAREDVHRIHNCANYFVLSSSWEGFGLVVAEAMATEKLVIATDSGGVAEVVGDCGFLVPINDHLALFNGMLQALNLEEEKKEMIQKKSRERINNYFSMQKTYHQWQEIYNSIKFKK